MLKGGTWGKKGRIKSAAVRRGGKNGSVRKGGI